MRLAQRVRAQPWIPELGGAVDINNDRHSNPRYLGYHVSGRTKKADFLLDPDSPALGHVTRQRWQNRAEWVTASVQTYDAIMDETTWHQVAALIAANSRTNVVTSAKHRTRSGVRRAEPSRYPLAGLVVCDCCGKKLQGNVVRGHAFYRCKVSSDYPVTVNQHPRSLAVREDRLLPHVNAWLCELFAPERIEATATQIVEVDSQGHREDPAVTRARKTLTECGASSPNASTAWRPASLPTSSPLG